MDLAILAEGSTNRPARNLAGCLRGVVDFVGFFFRKVKDFDSSNYFRCFLYCFEAKISYSAVLDSERCY